MRTFSFLSKLLIRIFILMLSVLGGWFVPALGQQSYPDSTSYSGTNRSAVKTPDLSPGEGLWLVS